MGRKDVACIITYDDRTPGCCTGSLQIPFRAVGVGCDPGLEDEIPVIQVQVHGSVIDQGSFVQVDIDAVGCFQLQ